MDLTEHRNSSTEQKRIGDLMKLVRQKGGHCLDVGARDGYLSIALTKFFDIVTALDLKKPDIQHEKVVSVKGDVTSLAFPDNSFDLVLCAEVLEHIPPHLLGKACSELGRVTKDHLIIGVPYKQDIRIGRTTCCACGQGNPPWGHINVFDENSLKHLFSDMNVEKISFIGDSRDVTNFISTFLFNLAKNPYGTYSQEEPCFYCGAKLKHPLQRNLFQKVCTLLAFYLNMIQKPFVSCHAYWIHILFKKRHKL